MHDWVDGIRDHIAELATRRGASPRQFASTLAALLVCPSDFVALHIGDSSIVGRRDGTWEVICWPENGEYASSTYFITDDPEPRLNIVRRPLEHNAFALFSDGIGDLALLHGSQQAHPGFLDPMIRPVDASSDLGRLAGLSTKLRDYLASPTVCERTDDDKTIVLLSGT